MGSGSQNTHLLWEVGVRIPTLEGREGKWESGYPIFGREVGVRVPYPWSGSGSQSTLSLVGKWESEYPIFGREVGVRVPYLGRSEGLFKTFFNSHPFQIASPEACQKGSGSQPPPFYLGSGNQSPLFSSRKWESEHPDRTLEEQSGSPCILLEKQAILVEGPSLTVPHLI